MKIKFVSIKDPIPRLLILRELPDNKRVLPNLLLNKLDVLLHIALCENVKITLSLISDGIDDIGVTDI